MHYKCVCGGGVCKYVHKHVSMNRYIGSCADKAHRQLATVSRSLKKRQSIDIYIHAYMHYICVGGGVMYVHIYMKCVSMDGTERRQSSSPASYFLSFLQEDAVDWHIYTCMYAWYMCGGGGMYVHMYICTWIYVSMHGAHGGKALRQPATDFLLLRKRQSIDIYIHAHMHYMCGRGGVYMYICTYVHVCMYQCMEPMAEKLFAS